MIDRDLVQHRIQEILTFARELQELSKISRSDFLKNAERQYAVMHLLQISIESCISVGNHIVARDRLGIPENYQDTFTLLERSKIISSEFAEEMKKMARFRNRLVHMYWKVDLDSIYEIITTKVSDFETFAKVIGKYLKQNPS